MKMFAFNEETKWRLLICFLGFTIGVAFVMGILVYRLQKSSDILTFQTAFGNLEKRVVWAEDYLSVLGKKALSHEQAFHIGRDKFIQKAIDNFQEYLLKITKVQ